MQIIEFGGNEMAYTRLDACSEQESFFSSQSHESSKPETIAPKTPSIRGDGYQPSFLAPLIYAGNPNKLLNQENETKNTHAPFGRSRSHYQQIPNSYLDLEDSWDESLSNLEMRESTYTISDECFIKNDWDSPDNLDNPKSWSLGKRIFHTALPAFYGFVLTFGTSAYIPAIPFVMMNFNVSRQAAILPLSFYTLGFAIGPVIYASLSEIHGRRIVYWISMPLFLVFTALCGVSNSVTMLTIMRFFAAFTGSGTLAVGAGTIQDLWNRKSQPVAALSFILAPFLGPCVGPLIGAFVMKYSNYNWRWSIWAVMLIATPAAIMSVFMQETSKNYILDSKNFSRLETKLPLARSNGNDFLQKLRHAIKVPLHMMIFEPLVAFLSIYTGFAFAMLFSFFTSYNFVFLVVYHLDQIQIGIIFVGILGGFILSIISFLIFDIAIYRKEEIRCRGNPAPEHRLYNSMLGSILLPISLFWFALFPRVGIHWAIPALSGILFGWATLGIFISTTAYLVDVYQTTSSSSAIAANGILRYGLGATFPLFTIQIYLALGIHWAGCVFAFFSVMLIPVPWIFYWKGKSLRARSYYDTNVA